jgi:hypothetical protein
MNLDGWCFYEVAPAIGKKGEREIQRDILRDRETSKTATLRETDRMIQEETLTFSPSEYERPLRETDNVCDLMASWELYEKPKSITQEVRGRERKREKERGKKWQRQRPEGKE